MNRGVGYAYLMVSDNTVHNCHFNGDVADIKRINGVRIM